MGRVVQSVACLTADVCLTADPGFGSSTQALYDTFLEIGHLFVCFLALRPKSTAMVIDHEISSTAILLPSADSRRVVVNYKGKYVQEVLVNCLVKLAQEKSVVR